MLKLLGLPLAVWFGLKGDAEPANEMRSAIQATLVPHGVHDVCERVFGGQVERYCVNGHCKPSLLL